MTDYERAMRQALRKLYPQAKLNACWFHFCQAVRRNANAIPGFVTSIRSSGASMEIYGKFLCLPLLPAHLINDAFNTLKEEAIAFDADLFNRFLSYYEKHWIRLVNRKSRSGN